MFQAKIGRGRMADPSSYSISLHTGWNAVSDVALAGVSLLLRYKKISS